MGLAKIFNQSEIPKSGAGNPKPDAQRPCANCAGQDFWLDGYGNWHCAACLPPPTPAMVRGRRTLDPLDLAGLVPPFILAVFDPDGALLYERPDVPTSQRWWWSKRFEELPEFPAKLS